MKNNKSKLAHHPSKGLPDTKTPPERNLTRDGAKKLTTLGIHQKRCRVEKDNDRRFYVHIIKLNIEVLFSNMIMCLVQMRVGTTFST